MLLKTGKTANVVYVAGLFVHFVFLVGFKWKIYHFFKLRLKCLLKYGVLLVFLKRGKTVNVVYVSGFFEHFVF